MKITSEIFQVGGGKLTAPHDAAIYLLLFEGHGALIDAGCGDGRERLLQNIRNCGVDPGQIEMLLLTHCHFDHTGGAKWLQETLACKVVAHELDALYLERGDDAVTAAGWYSASLEPFLVDLKLTGARQTLLLGGKAIEAIHIPGHSPGSLAYLVESDGLRILFAQDVHGPLDPSLLSDRADYIESLKLLVSLDADILCEGHYGVYQGKEQIRRFIKQFF